MFEKSRKGFKVSKKIKRKYIPCEVSKEDTKEYWRRVQKINELWQSYDKRQIGMSRTRRVLLRNEAIRRKN